MRALLINPWIYDLAAFDLWSKPLGLLTIAGHLRQRGVDIRLLDCLDRFHRLLPETPVEPPAEDSHYGSGAYYAEEIPKPPLFTQIPRRYKRYGLPLKTVRDLLKIETKTDVILVTSGMTYWYPAVCDMIALVKETMPGVPVILGGNYANLCFDHAKKHSGADHVFKGSSIPEILRLIDRVTCAAITPSPEPAIAEPLPAYDLYPRLSYVTLKTSHGCPFTCTYCGWHLIDTTFSRQDPGIVIDGIDHYYHALGVRNFAFYDDALLYDARKHFMKIADGIISRKITAHFLTPNGLHTAFVTQEVARLLKAAGFVKPRLALETASTARQRATGGKTTNEDFVNAVRHLIEAGYDGADIGVYLLIGLPGQAPAEIEASVHFASAAGVRIHLEEYSPIPGTEDYKKTGLAPDADPLLHTNSAFPLYGPELRKEIERLKDLVRSFNYGLQRTHR